MGRKEITTLIRNLCTQDLAWRDLSIPYILVELDKVHGKSVRTPKNLVYACMLKVCSPYTIPYHYNNQGIHIVLCYKHMITACTLGSKFHHFLLHSLKMTTMQPQ